MNKSKEQYRHSNKHGLTQRKSGAAHRRLVRLCRELFPGIRVKRGR